MRQAPPLAINARFLTQQVTGVQRFAGEMTRALWPLADCEAIAPAGACDMPGIAVRRVGLLRGHAWEQIELPLHAAGRVLVGLGNTGPLLMRRQLVVVHDARPFTMPQVYGWRFRTWYRALQRGLARRGVRIATISAFARGQLAHHLALAPDAIAVIGEGAEHILRADAEPGLHQRLGLVQPYVLAVGSLARHKNLAALSAAAAMLAARGMALVLTGDLDRRVFGAGEPGLPVPARSIGRVSDAALRALFRDAACFVFPSRDESFGLPAVEAMACGCPVVAARAGALPEVCGHAALLADPDDPADFAAALGRVLDDPALAARLRAAGLARAATMSWDAAARRLLAAAATLGPGEDAA